MSRPAIMRAIVVMASLLVLAGWEEANADAARGQVLSSGRLPAKRE